MSYFLNRERELIGTHRIYHHDTELHTGKERIRKRFIHQLLDAQGHVRTLVSFSRPYLRRCTQYKR